MLSAVESFGSASGPSAAHPYAHHHHNPYAIAAAAAAAGSAAAAAAAAVIPQAPLTPTTPTHPGSSLHSQQQQQQQHFQHQQQQQQQQQQLLLQQQHHSHHLGFFLPPPPTSSLALISPPLTSPSSCSTTSNSNSSHSNSNLLPTTALVLTSKCSPLQLAEYNHHHQQQQQQQHQQQQLLQHQQQQQQQQQLQQQQLHSPSRSPRRGSSLKSKQLQHQQPDDTDAMSSAEFARPHPKQPRYSNGTSNHSIPMHQRSPTGNTKSSTAAKICLNNNDKHLNLNANGTLKNGYACRTPPSKYSSNEQSGPVNLVTNHNNNNNNNSTNFASHARLSSTPPDGNCSSSSSSVDVENDGSMSPIGISLPPRKTQAESNSMLFGGGSNTNATKMPYDSAAAAAAVAAAAYQFNFPHLYASRAALYGASALFPGHHTALAPPPGTLRPHPAYLTPAVGQPGVTHESSSASFSVAYMQAVQNMYSHPTAQAPQPSPPAGQTALQHQPPKTMLRTPTGSMLALAPPAPASGVPTTASSGGLSNGHSALSLATPNDLRQKNANAPAALPQSTPTATVNGGTFLNGKVVNNTSNNSDSSSFFKVPSGKEGSLKHRILTRPSHSSLPTPEKPEPRSASITANVVRANNSTTNFTKGAYIELSNGVLRRVEDMRTEDFIQCAERSPHHQLAESTVVKINTTSSNNVVITFSYDKNRSKADVEVSPEHPFFVYGQGWASYNTELSHKLFALKCQRLQVGDICISLTSRESPATSGSGQTSNSQNCSMPQKTSQISPPSNYIRNAQRAGGELHALEKRVLDTTATQPQNLSRKVHPALQENINSTATPTSRLSSTLATGYPAMHSMPPMHLLPPHLAAHHSYADIAELAAAYAESAQISRGVGGGGGLQNAPQPPQLQNHLSPNAMSSFYQHHQQQQQHVFHATSPRLMPGQQLSAPMPIQMTRPASNHNPQPYYESPPSSTDGDPRRNHSGSSSGGGCDDEQDQPVDASMSRKRRWSAPESICDDDDAECQPPHMHQTTSSAVGTPILSGYKAFITTATTAAQQTP